MRHDGITVVVVVENVQGFGVFAFLQQLHAAGIGRIEFRGVDRVLDHPLAAQVVAEIHGPQLRVDHRTDIGILFRKPLPDGLLPPVGILFLDDQLQNSVTVSDLPVCSDAVCQPLPVFGHPPHGEHRVDASAVSADEVAFESLRPGTCQDVIRGIAALG